MRRPALAAALLLAAVGLASPAAGGAAAAATSPLLSQRPLAQRPEMMVLGTVHLANPRHDAVNADVDDMLAPRRQAEIARVVEALAAWRPTRVAVEWPHEEQAKLDARYADYRAGRRALSANETDQFGLRLAARLDLPRVDAVDWNGEPPGPDDAYDWEKGAKLAGEQARLDAVRAPENAARMTAMIRGKSVAGFLQEVNTPAYLADLNRVYYDLALLGTAETNPGATWVGQWYARNLRIFDNLVRLDARPDERILVVYGAGHGRFLNLFAEDSHAFRLVRPGPWLARAARAPKAR